MRPTDTLISQSRSWDEFWRALTTARVADVGDAFERLTQLYLLSHPEYRSQLAHVWRVPEEVPPRIRSRLRLPSTDEGIDLLAQTRDGKFWAIQCKFRAENSKRLTYGELSTFTSLAFVTCNGISLGVVAHTCSKPVRKHQYLGRTTEIGLDRWLALTDEDWRSIQAQIKGRATKLLPRVPRPHQQVAIEAAQKHFAVESRGRMIMPCGTGKSLTAFWIARALDAKSIIVAVPSLALIRQSLLDWTREYLAHGEEPQWLVVCSDESTGKLEQDEFVGETYDLGIPTTTQSEDIVPFLRKRTGRRIMFTTYQSSGALANAAREAGVKIDLAILDEAHKTVGVKSKAFATLLSDTSIPVRRRLFMTATERVLRGESDDVFSMDDEAVYGQRFHQLTFKDAIAQKIISDYRILTITVSDESIRAMISENRLIDVKGDETEAQALAAAIALRRAFHEHRIAHAISFHRSIKAASDFCDRQAVLDSAVQPRLASMHVSSKKSSGERAELMRAFVTESRALMTNARCLTEGVDVPAIDCVLFADPKQSVVDIVQAAGRALRSYPGKQYGYILLPLVVPVGMEVGTFAETTAFKQVARTITALSTQDERIAEQFRVVEYGQIANGKIVEVEGDVPAGIDLTLAAFAEQIGTKIWQRVGRANWRPFTQARDYAQSLSFTGTKKWHDFCRSGGRPPDIPSNPNLAYQRDGWVSMGDWLGTGNVATSLRVYRDYASAREFARSLNYTSQVQWFALCRAGKLPADIPTHPDRVWRGRGWVSWGDWLGTDVEATRGRKYRNLEEAKRFVHSLALRSVSEWRAYCQSGTRPRDIPAEPYKAYAKSWVSFGDWLGTGTVAPSKRQYREFEDGRDFVRQLSLKSVDEWRVFCKSGQLPADIPRTPYVAYADRWQDWRDWLGGEITVRGRHRPFDKARQYAQSLGLSSRTEWVRFCQSGKLPPDIPMYPDQTYAQDGWVNWGDWMGTGSTAPRLRQFRSFPEARAFVRTLGLSSQSEWNAYCRSGKLPRDIPTHPDRTYLKDGWSGTSDWLGCEPKRKQKR